MPLDPTISLDATSGQGPQQPGLLNGNALQTANEFATLGRNMVAAKSAQQEFAARQKAGQIIATAPDLATGISRVQADPDTAAWAPDLVNQMLAGQQTLTATQGAKQAQAQSGLHSVVGAMLPGMKDYNSFGPSVNAALATLSPSARAAVGPAAQSLESSLTDGLPEDPGQAQAEYAKRLNGLLVANGIGPDQINAVLPGGAPSTRDVGWQVLSGTTSPGVYGGGFQPTNGLAKTLSPQLTGDAAALPVGGAYGAGGGGGPANPLNPGPAPEGQITLGGRGTSAGGNPLMPSGASPAVQAPTVPLASDGKPLLAPGTITGPINSTGRQGVGGAFVKTQAQQAGANALRQTFDTHGADEFEGAQQTLQGLNYMDNAFDTLGKGGGLLTPGNAADVRANFAKGINTLAQIAGIQPPVDPSKVASAEEMNKLTRQVGLQLVKSNLAGGHTAAETITGLTSAVPGIENSYLGGKLLVDNYRAMAQRLVDKRQFQQAWMADPNSQGDLTGADVAFNKAHPVENYTQPVLDKYGLTEQGFKSPEFVKQALQQGLITPENARGILTSQFGDKFFDPNAAGSQGTK